MTCDRRCLIVIILLENVTTYDKSTNTRAVRFSYKLVIDLVSGPFSRTYAAIFPVSCFFFLKPSV